MRAIPVLGCVYALVGCDSAGGDPAEAQPQVGYTRMLSVGDPFVCDDGAECPTSCNANIPPELVDVVYLVNGEPVAEFGVGDDVTIRVSVEDADCNIGCGMDRWSFVSPHRSEVSQSTLCPNYPCSSGESGIYLGFHLGVIEGGQSYAYSASIEDACGDASNEVAETFNL